MVEPQAQLSRCAVHQARPAVNRCPVCDRPRCAPDAAEWPAGCAACEGVATTGPARRPVDARAVVGAAVACSLTTVFAGAVASQYVEVSVFEYLVPLGVGIGTGAAAEAGARGARGWSIRLVAVGFAVLGAAYGFRFEPAGIGPGDVSLRTVGVYLCAASGAWLWTVPPRRQGKRRRPTRSAEAATPRS